MRVQKFSVELPLMYEKIKRKRKIYFESNPNVQTIDELMIGASISGQ